ncbi:DUF1564 domain-containing protein [Leptospira barantonii]|uniref:DUF1564 domain-containing protein n=1 Tax=Leptospira barantonii TaxID=2023184 RepID=A0A5F2BV11_9LEPT|nr:DUF1564 domain-containing protein [Leptospira barantonii]TGM10248.1 DUF1564 domain-containing protein [Leptospira barantonii]
MEYVLLNMDQKVDSPLAERTNKVVTLLVPESYFDRLSLGDQRKLGKKLPYLLRRFSNFMVARSRLNRNAGATLYQNPGKMKKINFRVNTGHWAILGALAHAHGVSRCYLFNFLLSLDEVGVGDSIVKILDGGVPTFHENYKYIWQLDLTNNRISRHLEFSPNPLRTFYDTSFPWYQKFRTS